MKYLRLNICSYDTSYMICFEDKYDVDFIKKKISEAEDVWNDDESLWQMFGDVTDFIDIVLSNAGIAVEWIVEDDEITIL